MVQSEGQLFVNNRVSECVKHLKRLGIDCVVVGVNPAGYYSMQSNHNLSFANWLLHIAKLKVIDEIEASRQQPDNNNNQRKE